MATKKTQKTEAPSGPEDLRGMDSVSPEGGYAGPESEADAAKAAMNELPAPDPGPAE